MKKIFYSLFILTFICSCDKDEDNETPQVEPVTVSEGLYIVNEGNYYSQINGSLSYLDYATDSIANNLFAKVNGRVLGATPNSAAILGDSIYIACTDENRIEVVSRKTLVAGSPIGITQPREMVVSNGCVFVTSYDGCVYKINGRSMTKSEKVGACLEGITSLNGKLYICNAYNPDYTYNTNVIMIDEGLNRLGDIMVTCNPITALTDGKSVYVLSNGNYSDVSPQIQQIDSLGNAKYLCDGSQMAYHDGKLYIIASSYDANWQMVTTYNIFDLKSGTESTFTDGKDIEYPSAINVDPVSGDVYISSLHISEYGYGDYNNPGYLVRYTSSGKMKAKHDVGVNPNTLLFSTTTK